jgi:hypothetical protein
LFVSFFFLFFFCSWDILIRKTRLLITFGN